MYMVLHAWSRSRAATATDAGAESPVAGGAEAKD